MVDQNSTPFFNKIYEETYKKAFGYVTTKCGDTSDIADILQETYCEVYSVILKKGEDYIQNYEAFVLRVAKTKVFKFYSLREKMSHLVPMFASSEHGEVNLIDLEWKESLTLEDRVLNKALYEQIAHYIAQKSELTKKVFYLFYYSEYTIPQIAKGLKISESAVKNRLYRTVKEVRALYGKDGTFYE